MNWITNTVLPKIRRLASRPDTPDNLWERCPGCGQMLFHRDLEANQKVCHHCGHHMRIGPKERFQALFDDGKHTVIELPDVQTDPLRFRDAKRYTDRLRDARNKTGDTDAMVVAHGQMNGANAVVAVQNFAFMGGSLGLAVGEALISAANLAILQDSPLIVFTAAGGARMQEGILSLMQMPRTTIAVQQMREAGLPYIVVLTDPTSGGVTASYAMLGDFQISEPGAFIGFAGPRVIEQTIPEQLPDGFQRAEYLLEHGMLDMVVHRRELKETLVRLIDLVRRKKPGADVVPFRPAEKDLEIPKLEEQEDKELAVKDKKSGSANPSAGKPAAKDRQKADSETKRDGD